MNEALLEARGVERFFQDGERRLEVLLGVDLEVAAGETVVVVGASGTGKSTLLHILGALDRPTSGRVRIGDRWLDDLSVRELALVRNREVGFVFQMHHLLLEFSALENVMLPLMARGESPAESRRRAEEILARVGLSDRLLHSPVKLSGGEQQRVAIARALVGGPALVFMDEPTGNLDPDTAERVLNHVFALAGADGTSFIIVTHDGRLAARADRALTLSGGKLIPMEAR
ncbi:MAG: ABC transporter ATP-binding protein [bacterium]|nr:ABC transporter ATP-binding protein [bacterium]